MTNRKAPAAAVWSRLVAVSAFGGVLAGCGSSGGSGDGGPTLSLGAVPTTLALGQSATLTWSSSQGTSCAASGGWSGEQPQIGTADVTPTAAGAVSYTLTCSGGGFVASSTKSVTLTVVAPSAYTTTSLVENFAGGAAPTTDLLLVNPWGIAFAPTTAAWVANNHSETATIYNGAGRASPLVARFASGTDSFAPTGIVYNPTGGFAVSAAGQSAPAAFIFAGESGAIAGWSLAVDPPNAVTMYAADDDAVYKGLALANNGGGNFLYATDFANGKIDVFDAAFAKQPSTPASFAFDDPTLPSGYAPFGIQAVGNGASGRIYVSYAKRDEAEPDDDAPGPGLGLVDVFDTSGNLLKHLVAEGGKLNAPWGMALAPADFGTLSGALLVGNFGDGTIQGYDSSTGRYLGAVADASRAPFEEHGLWGMAFGNDAANQPHATLFFAAGINGEVNGRYGRVDLGPIAPVLGETPAITLIVPPGDLSGTVTLTANAENLAPVTKVQFYLNGGTLVGTATAEPFTAEWDTRTVDNGSATLRAVATDDNGNVGSSAILTVSVANPVSGYGGAQPPGAISTRPRRAF